MDRKTVLGCILMVLPVSLSAQSTDELLRRAYVSAETGEEREYFVYLPVGYHDDESGQWPLMLFLHGGGERGNGRDDLDWVLVHGPLYEAWIQRRALPFVMISPQLPLFDRDPPDRDTAATPPARLEVGTPPREPHYRALLPELRTEQPIRRTDPYEIERAKERGMEPYPPNDMPPDGWFRIEEDLIAMLDATEAEFRIDTDRVYLTGLSYGGFGTFDLAANHPGRFAAIAPIVGTGNMDDVPRLVEAELPIWLFGGGADPVVNPHWLYAFAGALEKAGHPDFRFTVHEDMGHDAWVRVYAGKDLYSWLLGYTKR